VATHAPPSLRAVWSLAIARTTGTNFRYEIPHTRATKIRF
jgi:hypothetical protein